MPETKKTSVISRFYSQTDRLFNRLVIFVSGIFVSAIFYLFLLKILGSWGIYLALGGSSVLNVWLKKKYPKDFFLNTLNNGFITFNIFTVIAGIVVLILFFGAVQSALN